MGISSSMPEPIRVEARKPVVAKSKPAPVTVNPNRLEIVCDPAPKDKCGRIKFFDENGQTKPNRTGFAMAYFPEYLKDYDGFFDPRRYDVKGNGVVLYNCLDGTIEYRDEKFWRLT